MPTSRSPCRAVAANSQTFALLKRKALPTTDTELKLIATAAIIGELDLVFLKDLLKRAVEESA